MSIQIINPATGGLVREYAAMSPDKVNSVVQDTHNAFLCWKRIGNSDRASLMRRASELLREHAKEYAALMAEEMGKPIEQGTAEVEKCAWVCEYYADHAESFLRPEYVETEAERSYISFQPLGVILAIMPWNYPFWQVFRFAAPALMAGNGCILKHASNVSGCALAIERLFRESGFPEHLMRVVLIPGSSVGAAVFTRDIRRGERIAVGELEAGCCFVNDYVRSDPRLPFGGVKSSGYGRELSLQGIREFVNVKTVYVAGSPN